MKKNILMMVATFLAMTASAQKANSEMKYRRSSLYTIMVPSDKLTGDAKNIVTSTFDTLAIPDKYNDHNLSVRHIDITKIEVTDDEIKAVEEHTGGAKKGIRGLAKKGLSMAKQATATSETGAMSGNEKIARVIKYFKENHIANKIIGKWYNESATMNNGSHFNTLLIEDRGLFGASQEEINKYKGVIGGQNKIMDAAEKDLIPRTFVMVTTYAYLSAEEVTQMVSAGASMLGGYAGAATAVAGSFLKGYFVTTTSYLFQLDWNEEKMMGFYDKYWNAEDTKEFDTDDAYQLTYVGKTTCYAPATLKLTTNDDASQKLISRATVRATDKSLAQLQRKYEQFKTLSVLNVADDGTTMYAYIGKKEGVQDGDKFDVLEQIQDADGNISYKKVGTVKVAKGKVWDNRAGAGEKIEGEATDKEDGDAANDLKYTIFDGKPNKAMADGGLWLRQAK